VALGTLLVLGPLSFGLLPARLNAVGFFLGASKEPPILAMSLPQALAGEAVVRMMKLYGLAPVDALLLVVTLVWALGHRHRADRPLLWFGHGMFVFFVLMVRTKNEYYVIQWFPLVALLLASAARQAAEEARGSRWPAVFVGIVAVVGVGLAANRVAFDVLPWQAYDHRAFAPPLRQAIPPGATVLGEPTYWLELQDHPYLNWWTISYIWQAQGRSPRESLDRHRPDAIIVDPHVRYYFDASPPPLPLLTAALTPPASPFWRPVMLPQVRPSPLPGSLEEALGQHYRLVYTGFFPGHGKLEVWLRVDGT
jgi:hypothetical protein